MPNRKTIIGNLDLFDLAGLCFIGGVAIMLLGQALGASLLTMAGLALLCPLALVFAAAVLGLLDSLIRDLRNAWKR